MYIFKYIIWCVVSWSFILWKFGNVRTSRPEVFCKNVFLENSQNLQENTCARVSFLKADNHNFIKKRLQYWCFPVKFARFSGTPFFTRTPLMPPSITRAQANMIACFCFSNARAHRIHWDFQGMTKKIVIQITRTKS